jgi:uncharacterized protein (TIGR03000 family)
MYSLVLATMLTAGGATPAWGFGCHGCHGCCGGCYGNAFSCHGCCGGCYGGCQGCWGGCYGCSGCYGGCYGSCYGSAGGAYMYSSGTCYGCNGCSGYSVGCYGCFGMHPQMAAPQPQPFVPPARMAPGRVGGPEGAGAPPGGATVRPRGERPNAPPPSDHRPMPPAPTPRPSGEGSETEQAAAHVTVTLPADAVLYVQDVPCPLSSSTRTFDTPELQAGQTYYYTVRAEVVRDGQKRAQTRTVSIEAGQPVQVDFGDLTTAPIVKR